MGLQQDFKAFFNEFVCNTNALKQLKFKFIDFYVKKMEAGLGSGSGPT
jgi:hypothetical protein